MRAILTAACVAGLALFPLVPASAANSPVDVEQPIPKAMLGVWAPKGLCGVKKRRLTITATSAGWGAERYPVFYADYGTNEGGALFWRAEYQVDNFQLGAKPDVLVYNSQGFHMPGSRAFFRCNEAR